MVASSSGCRGSDFANFGISSATEIAKLSALNPVKMLHAGSCYETNGGAGEAIFQFGEDRLKQTCGLMASPTTGCRPMWKIINALYREYCLARLNEMRRLELNC